MSFTILIADDSPFFRNALCNVFEREEDFDVCGEAENGREAVEKAQELHPDLILLVPFDGDDERAGRPVF
jgi:chemotaxis response regulator CheB